MEDVNNNSLYITIVTAEDFLTAFPKFIYKAINIIY